jgi:hypothetical protein
MVGEITQTINSYLDYLRELSWKNSEENQTFVKNKLLAHRDYMEYKRKTNPYLHPDDWQD